MRAKLLWLLWLAFALLVAIVLGYVVTEAGYRTGWRSEQWHKMRGVIAGGMAFAGVAMSRPRWWSRER